MQGHKYFHICNLWGKFLPAGMICTTSDTISIPVGAMYLHPRMFCPLAHMSSIPMGVRAWNLFWAIVAKLVLWKLIYCPVHLLICLLYPWVQCQSLKPVLSQCSQTGFVTVDDFISLYTRSYIFIHMGAINFYLQERCLHSLIWLLYPWVWCIYMQECSVHLLICVLFLWVQ